MSLAPILTAAQVAERYGYRDLRAARRLMRRAGGFKVGGRLVIRAEDLGRHEQAQLSREGAPVAGQPPPAMPDRSSDDLPAGWWRR